MLSQHRTLAHSLTERCHMMPRQSGGQGPLLDHSVAVLQSRHSSRHRSSQMVRAILLLAVVALASIPCVLSAPWTPSLSERLPVEHQELSPAMQSLLAQLQAAQDSGQLPGGPSAMLASLTRDKWIGLGLAISSSLAIGISSIITKKGLIDAAEQSGGLSTDEHSYLQNPIWWAGMGTMIVGEIANFAAYTFAPPILVTPLGALSVLIGAILASLVLKEELGRLGRVGCTLCLVGTVIIVLNAPEDKEVQTVDQILNYALQPAFLAYCLFVFAFAMVAIWRVAPTWGKRTPLVYISICSLVGSISVMSVKGFGVALKLTFDGNNQFTHPSTYCFAIVVVVCILVQMNYFNKALDQFSTNVVNPIYYVMFTTSTIFASFILFQGFNTAGAGPAMTLLGGFVVIFLGVYLLNLNRLIDPVTQQPRMSLVTGEGVAGTGRLSEHRERLLGNDSGMFHPRMSMTGARASFSNSGSVGRRGSQFYQHGSNRRDSSGSSVLFSAYENEEAVGLTQLNEAYSDEESEDAMSPAVGRKTPPSRPNSAGAARSPSVGYHGHPHLPNHTRTGSLKAARLDSAQNARKVMTSPKPHLPNSTPVGAPHSRTPAHPNGQPTGDKEVPDKVESPR